ncbi:pyruvate kinase, partial [Mycoplasma putrefaciens]
MKNQDLQKRVKRTKIITTIGPSTDSIQAIQQLFENGMNTIRLNFSHGNYQEHGARIAAAKQIREQVKQPISILLDTKGPEIRVGKFQNGKQEILRW